MEPAHDTPSEPAPSQPTGIAGLIQRVTAWALQRRLVRALLLYSERRGPMLADSITYRSLFSVFAGVLLGFSIATVWLADNPQAWRALIAAVDAAIPGLFGEDGVITDPDRIPVPAGLSIAGVISFVALIGAALGAVGSLRTAVRTIADTVLDDVMIVWVVLRNILLAAGIAAAFLAAAALTVLGRLGVSWITGLLGIAADSPAALWGVRALSLLIVLALDAALIIGVWMLLSGRRAPWGALWPGALLGAVGLIVLQELSSLFVGGASSNPLLASFASLLALLIWLNFSAQVILIACAVIVTGIEEHEDRVSARFGARTLAQRRVQRAEHDVSVAVSNLKAARDALPERKS
ncbi:YihY/virulence factor BrkB family protein [Microbacterium sp. CIAB417]|uniref:YihY/virulence factor BrkB family protein n=1 Tax=Microbacterium sp. CIAB417 TaxID=2860287 RepID=UPI001FAC7F67|nr:YihY/virulence factor BrkB family protein [Microbacterium sp. CIAB417]